MNSITLTLFAVFISGALIPAPAMAQSVVDESFRVDEKDFATPGDALSHFVASIRANDLTAALQAFAVNEYAEKYDFEAYSTRIGAITPMLQSAPGQYPMYEQLNRLGLLSQYGGAIRNFVYSFNASIPLDQTFRVTSPDEIDAFVASVDPARMAGLEVVEAYTLAPNSAKAIEIMKAQVGPIGADESTEIFILYELDGQYFAGGAHLLRYGDAWKIDLLSSVYARIPASGVVSATSREEFGAKVAELQEAGVVLPEKILP